MMITNWWKINHYVKCIICFLKQCGTIWTWFHPSKNQTKTCFNCDVNVWAPTVKTENNDLQSCVKMSNM